MRRMFLRLGLGLVPKRTLTSFAGKVGRHPISRHLIPWYVRHYRIDEGEVERPLAEYESLVAFFSRRLKPGARPVGQEGVVSPVDGTVSERGRIVDGMLLQAKGCRYSVEALLGDRDWAAAYHHGHYITIYLSPRDYHRIHVPLDGTAVRWRYIPGSLYPVNRYGVAAIRGLFSKNERLVTEVVSPHGRYAIVKIGATVVGSVRTHYGPAYHGPFRRSRLGVQNGVLQLPLQRGDELGRFEFGSTVVVLFEPNMIGSFTVESGRFVRMGEMIATLR